MAEVRVTSILAIILLSGLLIACSSPGVKTIENNLVQLPKDLDVKPSYKLGPGDKLKVFVWGNPDLSADVVVRPDGYITTPLVEDVKASGSTAAVLAAAIEKKLGKYIKTPNVTVSILSFVGRYEEQVRVVGHAARPKALSYKENMTVLDVIIAVGGLTEFADGNEASIVREIENEKGQFKVRLDDLIKRGDISANVRMKQGDILIIPESWL